MDTERLIESLANQDPHTLASMLVEMAHYGDRYSETHRLQFKPNPDDAALALRGKAPSLKFDRNLSHAGSGLTHRLIIGDNIHALMGLTLEAETFDVITIDPPYNTGSEDFVYNDRYVDAEDSWRHTKWMSFMEPRIRLAHRLLNREGVMVVFIGREERENIVQMLDTVFGPSNRLFVVTRMTKAGSAQGTFYAPSADYIAFYAKDRNALEPFGVEVGEDFNKKFKHTDDRGNYTIDTLYKSSLTGVRPNQRYWIECPDGSLCIPEGGPLPSKAVEGDLAQCDSDSDRRWRWSRDRYLREKGNLVFKRTKSSPLVTPDGNRSEWNVYTKQYQEEDKTILPREIWTDATFQNGAGTRLLKEMGESFSFSKPVDLIAHVIKIMRKGNDIKVLDFFAGSGTTGHAVLALNAEDGGSRTFTLVTNNENNIGETTTRNRVVKAMTGTGWASGDREGLGGSLAVYRAGVWASRYDLRALTTDRVDDDEREEWLTNSHALVATSLGYPWLVEEHSDDFVAVYADRAVDPTRHLVIQTGHEMSLDAFEEVCTQYPQAITCSAESGLSQHSKFVEGCDHYAPLHQFRVFSRHQDVFTSNYHPDLIKWLSDRTVRTSN